MSQFDAVVNALPAPTWNRLHMNEVKMGLEENRQAGRLKIEKPNEILLGQTPEDTAPFANVPTGMGSDVDKALAGGSRVAVLTADTVVDEPALLTFTFEPDQLSPGFFVGIEAKEEASMTVIMDFTAMPIVASNADTGTAVVQTRILAQRKAAVKLVQIHRAGAAWTVLNDSGSVCQEEAKVEILHIVLDGKNNLIGCRTELVGNDSTLKTKTVYRAAGQDRVDMNYIANHLGRRSTSDMEALGVLRGEAVKVYRGTIDFKRGAKAAVGNEKEDVLLIDEGVINQTIPLILCAEEDVEGNHGATIGQLDEEAMFYLQSRGMTPESVPDMLERGRLVSVITQIGDKKTEDTLLAAIGETQG